MLVEEDDIRELCTEAVFKRGEEYLQNGRIQRLDRHRDVLNVVVEGSQLYDVTVEIAGSAFAPSCTCPYTGPGECKHVVAVLLAVAADPPEDQSSRVEAILEDVTATDLRSFVETVIARNPKIREQFFPNLARIQRNSLVSIRLKSINYSTNILTSIRS